MPAPTDKDTFTTANQHALATILDASQTRSIIASRDIFDISGTKLWARDQPVSASLQRKLLDRQLRNPLETCLLVEDGVNVQALVQCAEALVACDSPIGTILRPHAAGIIQETAFLPLHSVAQLLLTAGQAARPESFDHAVQSMALAGALMITHGGSTAEVRVAMLSGLLHDLGEMYIDPRHGEADADRRMDFQSYEHLVVHPHVGRLLIEQLTNYPAAIGRAIGEHHERMDGSGYPHALRREALSPLGRLLAVTEAALGVLRSDSPDVARVSVALRVIPGEYDLAWIGHISNAARAAPTSRMHVDRDEVQARLARLDSALSGAHGAVRALAAHPGSPALMNALALSQHLITRLRSGWYASGLWNSEALDATDAVEVESVEDELFYRMRSIERATLLRAGKLPPDEAERLSEFCGALDTGR